MKYENAFLALFWGLAFVAMLLLLISSGFIDFAGGSRESGFSDISLEKRLPDVFVSPHLVKANNPQLSASDAPEASLTSKIDAPDSQSDSGQDIVRPGDRKSFFLFTRVLGIPGKAKMSKRSFVVPDGWQLVSAELIKSKGLARVYQRQDSIYLEAHSLAFNARQYEESYGRAEIVLEKL